MLLLIILGRGGLNEHNKGLLRQFLPKKTNFKILKPKEVERAVNLINNRGGSITAEARASKYK
ncbi:hypothetical protein B1L04_09635 [Microcystis aeruginosa KW]|uniref:Uncharacterized protein n=2 Tax=Microcystis aeruginosa TaxID=1126 RepID=A0A1V4BY30_MICAE|nr:hypothetical protein B1L04_09635 [Microcystis aeruginosa KW]